MCLWAMKSPGTSIPSPAASIATTATRDLPGERFHQGGANKAERCNNIVVQGARGVGLATGQGSDPITELRFSDDQGRSWSDWFQTSPGAVGQYRTAPYGNAWALCVSRAGCSKSHHGPRSSDPDGPACEPRAALWLTSLSRLCPCRC